MFRCLVSQNPSSWSQQLSLVEYAHNSLPVSSTGLSPFECSLGYQPPIFPSLESEVTVPSAHAFVQRCRGTWGKARPALLQVGARTKAQAVSPFLSLEFLDVCISSPCPARCSLLAVSSSINCLLHLLLDSELIPTDSQQLAYNNVF